MNSYDDQGGPQPGVGPNDPNAFVGGPALPTSGLSIGSLVCGILSITCCYPLGFTGLALGIPAIIMGVIARKAVGEGRAGGSTSGFSLAGLICGSVGTALGIAYIILIVVVGISGGFNPPPGGTGPGFGP